MQACLEAVEALKSAGKLAQNQRYEDAAIEVEERMRDAKATLEIEEEGTAEERRIRAENASEKAKLLAEEARQSSEKWERELEEVEAAARAREVAAAGGDAPDA